MQLSTFAERGNSLAARRALECLAIGMIGDGALAFVEPKRHAELWVRGPGWWQSMVRPFAKRPQLTRWFGAGEALCGFWLAARQRP
jgi:hypothetical protein